MAYRFLGADFSDFITTSDEIGISFVGQEVSQIKMSTPKCNIYYKTEDIQEDLFIVESLYQMQDDVSINGKGESALLEIQFNLSEKDIFYKDKFDNDHLAPARSGNIMFLSEEDNEADILFQKNVRYGTFDIHLPLTALNHFWGESKLMDSFIKQINENISGPLFQNTNIINSRIYSVIQEIKSCVFEGLSRKIYLQSKTFELIALLYEGTEKRQGFELSNKDKERLHEAASIIRDNIETPYSIIELAHKVGINQTKLKTGFKSLFGNTVFGYLQDIRMDQAKRYLLDTQLSVHEIGVRVGYQNTSNFSTAFKNTHGYTPSKLREK